MCEAVSGGMGYMRNLYPPLNIAMNLKLPPKHKEKKKKKKPNLIMPFLPQRSSVTSFAFQVKP